MSSVLSFEQKQTVYRKYGRKCFYCGQVENGDTITIDHIIPVSQGGTHFLDNCVPSCRKCNLSKKDLYTDEWLAILKIRRNKMFNTVKKITKTIKTLEDRKSTRLNS